jgi:hypothetical protein
MDTATEAFLKGKRFAIVGVSRSGTKFGNAIQKEMKERGYQMYIIHPEAQEIGGEKCYPNLGALPEAVDGVVICVPPQQAGEVMRQAVQAGIQNVWLQQGAQSPAVLRQATELGIKPVEGKCILMYAQPVRSFHSWHRFFAKLFGQL